jgi:hypothetical protein
MTCASSADNEIVAISTMKHFLITYLIGKVDVVLELIPMGKSFVFPTAVSSAVTYSICIYLHVLGG